MSFLKELEKLGQPAPQLPDLEDNEFDTLQLAERNDDEEFETTTKVLSKAKISRALELSDEKYRGQKVSRSELFGDSSEIGSIQTKPISSGDEDSELDFDEEELDDEDDVEDEDEDDSDNDDDSEISDSELQNAFKKSDDEDAGGDDEEENEDEDEAEHDKEEEGGETFTANNFLKTIDQDKEIKKAQSVAQQLKIWEQVLFLKIKLQSAMRAFNQLPRGKLAIDLLASADEKTKENYKAARANIQKIVSMLIEAEKAVLSSSHQTKEVLQGKEGLDSSDEEIESSEDEKDDDDNEDINEDEDDLKSDDDEVEDKDSKNKVVSWKKVQKILEENEEKFSKFRTKTIAKWDERTRFIVPKKMKDAKKDFSSFSVDGINGQIEKVMRDKARQLRRFHVKRSEFERIGGDSQIDEDNEIFDDDDFYQNLLKELIEKKSTNLDDPVAMTRHYIEMQKLRNQRNKKKIKDNKLAKEKKIKYVPIPKLVNFHPARPEVVEWSHEARNDLFKSLFK